MIVYLFTLLGKFQIQTNVNFRGTKIWQLPKIKLICSKINYLYINWNWNVYHLSIVQQVLQQRCYQILIKYFPRKFSYILPFRHFLNQSKLCFSDACMCKKLKMWFAHVAHEIKHTFFSHFNKQFYLLWFICIRALRLCIMLQIHIIIIIILTFLCHL